MKTLKGSIKNQFQYGSEPVNLNDNEPVSNEAAPSWSFEIDESILPPHSVTQTTEVESSEE